MAQVWGFNKSYLTGNLEFLGSKQKCHNYLALEYAIVWCFLQSPYWSNPSTHVRACPEHGRYSANESIASDLSSAPTTQITTSKVSQDHHQLTIPKRTNYHSRSQFSQVFNLINNTEYKIFSLNVEMTYGSDSDNQIDFNLNVYVLAY